MGDQYRWWSYSREEWRAPWASSFANSPRGTKHHLGCLLCATDQIFKAMEKLKPNATGIYVAAHQAPGAIEEAIEAEVPLVVAVAEHIPIHDMLRVC